MPEDPRDELVTAAHLDDRAAAVVRELPDAAVAQLRSAWEAAVRAQDAEVDRAVEDSLSMVPRLLRKQVMRVLTGGRS